MRLNPSCLALILVTVACGGGTDSERTVPAAVGQPCLRNQETSTTFGGSPVTEVDIADTAEPQVRCVSNHFQGRASCPYGQTDADLSLPASDPRRCRTPSSELVTVAVAPQLSQRLASDVVHLSCRCAGPDPDASYCGCPTGFVCSHLLDDLGLGDSEYAGSYCLLAGTQFLEGTDYGPACDRSAAAGTPGYCQ